MKIKIVGEEKHKIKKHHPPKSVFFKYQPGETHKDELTSFLQERYTDISLEGKTNSNIEEEFPVKLKTISDLDLYITGPAFDKLYRHCAKIAQKGLEAMGFMIGELHEYNEKIFSVVHDALTSNLESTSISVRFHRDAFEHLFDQLDEIPYYYVIIGWYHSHPGFSSFMSQVDIDTQKRIFNKLFHAALVVDPISYEVKSFRMQNSDCVEIPYAVFSESKQEKEYIPFETVSIKCPKCGKSFNVRKIDMNKDLICSYCDFVFDKEFKF